MPAEQLGAATLYLADAFELMPQLGEVDCIITDPPYNGKTHNGARSSATVNERRIDFECITEQQLISFCEMAVMQARRWVVFTCAWQHAAALEKAGQPLVRLGIWHKVNGAPQFTGDRPATGWEAVAILHRGGRKRWNGGGLPAVWPCAVEHGEHPTQKPLRLLLDWVAKFTDPGELVLDPFMGSGTTGLACLKMGRRFIGIEKDPRYYALAVRRLTDFCRQATLFEETGAEG